MKKTIIRIMQVTFAIAAFATAILCEDFCFRGAGLLLGMALVCIGFIMFEHISDFGQYITVLGCIFCFTFLYGLAVELHIEETAGGVAIKSAYYTHVLESGERIERKELRSNYSQYYSQWDVDTQVFYFLYNGTHCSVYNRYGKVLDFDTTFTFEEKDYGHGIIDVIRAGDCTFDMRGTEIKEDYSPYTLDRTPDYNSAN